MSEVSSISTDQKPELVLSSGISTETTCLSRKEPFCLPLTQPPLKVQHVSQGQQLSVPALNSPQEFPANLQKIQYKFSDVIQVQCSYKSSKVKELHSNYIFVKGRLKLHVTFWPDIGTSQNNDIISHQ